MTSRTDKPISPGETSGPGEIQINVDRLWNDLLALSEIGRGERGVSRVAFSPADMEGRRWLLRRFEDAGIPARMDAYGNVFGRLQGARRDEAPRGEDEIILIGSHIDTVPEGGMFDGALGVLAGLECLRALRERGEALPYTVDVVAFSNEEGSRLGPGTFGSRALLEGISEAEWSRVCPVLKEAGLSAKDLEDRKSVV